MRDFADNPQTTVTRLEQNGMVTLRADLADPEIARALEQTGLAVPPQRRIIQAEAGGVGWMSPDEALILCGADALADLLAGLGRALEGRHALLANVSDARARYAIAGPEARETLAKLCPVDLAPGAFEPGELRRTRLAQVAAAFWMTAPDAFELVCFRSVADYVDEALRTVSRPGAQIGLWTTA